MRRKPNKAKKPVDGKKAREQKRIVGIGDWHAENGQVLELRWVGVFIVVFTGINFDCCRFQWPVGPRRRSAAARMLRLLVRIPPGPWMFVECVVCCQVEVSATS